VSEPTTVAEAIEDSALGPAEVRSQDISFKGHSIPDLIAAAKYLAGRELVSSPTAGLGIRMVRIRPPGGI